MIPTDTTPTLCIPTNTYQQVHWQGRHRQAFKARPGLPDPSGPGRAGSTESRSRACCGRRQGRPGPPAGGKHGGVGFERGGCPVRAGPWSGGSGRRAEPTLAADTKANDSTRQSPRARPNFPGTPPPPLIFDGARCACDTTPQQIGAASAGSTPRRGA
jgi:hypothetical protein